MPKNLASMSCSIERRIFAEASNSNEIRAEHYATAEYYLHLADVEANLAGQFDVLKGLTQTGLASLGQGGASWPGDASLDHLVGAGEQRRWDFETRIGCCRIRIWAR
jgi:hypothetical protein